MSVSYIYTKRELFLLISNLNVNYKKFSPICEPFIDENVRVEVLESLYKKRFIIIDGTDVYMDKVISFMINQLVNATRLIKVNDNLLIYICPNILITIQFDILNTSTIRLTCIKDVNMLKEEFNINLKEGNFLE